MSNDGRIKVYLRIRPSESCTRQSQPNFEIQHSFSSSSVIFHVDKCGARDVVNNSVENYEFRFSRAFGPSTVQQEIFSTVARGCVMSALEGLNATLFAYGVSGSGKTYSLTGGSENYEARGIIPRALSLIFEQVHERIDKEWTIKVSYLQIYNEKGQDLLNRGQYAKTLDDLPSVSLHEQDGDVVLRGLEAKSISNIHEALDVLFLGDTNRLYCETPMNKSSSRSHCIFCVHIESRSPGGATVRRSKLNLVDLAGSERVYKTGVDGNLLQEAKYINLSLHFLEHVIVALTEQLRGQRDHVPFRESLITMCLRDSLLANCSTAMLATAHPDAEFMLETISTCKFAQRVACIRQDAHVNETLDPNILVKRLRSEVTRLREELSFYGRTRDSVGRRVLDADETQLCREAVTRFLEDSDAQAEITGLEGDINRFYACCRIMKEMLKGSPKGIPTISAVLPPSPAQATPITANEEQLTARVETLMLNLRQRENELSTFFRFQEQSVRPLFNATTQTGESDDSMEPPCATASKENVLAAIVAERRNSEESDMRVSLCNSQIGLVEDSPNEAAVEDSAAAVTGEPGSDLLADLALLRDRQAAFEKFRREYRKYEHIERNKVELRNLYDDCKQIAGEVNMCVERIRDLKKGVQQYRAMRALDAVLEPSNEELRLESELAKAKELYVERGKTLGEAKERVDQMHLVLARGKEQMTKAFEEWFNIRARQLKGALAQNGRRVKDQLSKSLNCLNVMKGLVEPFPSSKVGAATAVDANGSAVVQSLSHRFSVVNTANRSPDSTEAERQQSIDEYTHFRRKCAQQLEPHSIISGPSENSLCSSLDGTPLSLCPSRDSTNGDDTVTRSDCASEEQSTMNPFAPRHRSSGDPYVDRRMAEIYKARELAKQRLNQERPL